MEPYENRDRNSIDEKQALNQKINKQESSEELLLAFANSLDDLAVESKEGLNVEYKISSNAAHYWFRNAVGTLPKANSPYEAAEKFREIADNHGVIKKENFRLSEKNKIINALFISSDCPYKKCCGERKAQSKGFVCFRAIPFITAINLMTGQDYRREVIVEKTTPGQLCTIQASPMESKFSVGYSYKLSSGTIKVNELDLPKIGIDIIDTVKIIAKSPEGKENNMIALAYSQTKYPTGMIIMNIKDAIDLGIKEKDVVSIKKASAKESPKIASFDLDSKQYEGMHTEDGESTPHTPPIEIKPDSTEAQINRPVPTSTVQPEDTHSPTPLRQEEAQLPLPRETVHKNPVSITTPQKKATKKPVTKNKKIQSPTKDELLKKIERLRK
jgi:hypothetical protein